MTHVAGRVAWPGRTADTAARITFTDLVRAHHAWRGRVEDAVSADAFADALRRFERAEGRLESAYWCTHAVGGAAVTRRRRHRRFHRATAGHPAQAVSTLLNECDELGVRIAEVLRGTGQRIAIGLVLRTAANLLSLEEDEAVKEAIEHERGNLDDAQAYYRRAARRQAQLIFVGGMLAGVLLLTALVLAILAVVHATANVEWIAHGGKLGTEVSL